MSLPTELLRLGVQTRLDFEWARRKAFLNAVAAFFRRRPNLLISFAEVERHLPIQGQVYRGVRPIPLAAVRGSVDRYHDFDRNFFPRQTHTRGRWESVDRANLADYPLPAIKVYQVGAVYFVRDGNHRVSVARQRGMLSIDAEVTEVQTPVPLDPETDPRDLLRLAEHARFMAATRLDLLRPETTICCTALGSYDRLLEHVRGHRWFLGLSYRRPFTWDEAVQSWHDTVYAPLAALIAEHEILAAFPGRTATDLYLWVVEHGYYRSLAEGRDVGPEATVDSFDRHQLSLARRLRRGLRRLVRMLMAVGASAGVAAGSSCGPAG